MTNRIKVASAADSKVHAFPDIPTFSRTRPTLEGLVPGGLRRVVQPGEQHFDTSDCHPLRETRHFPYLVPGAGTPQMPRYLRASSPTEKYRSIPRLPSVEPTEATTTPPSWSNTSPLPIIRSTSSSLSRRFASCRPSSLARIPFSTRGDSKVRGALGRVSLSQGSQARTRRVAT